MCLGDQAIPKRLVFRHSVVNVLKENGMLPEKDVSQEENWYHYQIASKCLQGLKRRNITGYYFSNRDESRDHILKTIPPQATVGFGDSVTLHQTGVLEALQGRGQKIISPFWKNGSSYFPATLRETVQMGKETLFVDYFLAGINSIVVDGRIVNTDGRGNRVAAIIFGPRRVILVAGINKIVANIDEALERVKKVAAPLNARRHLLKHGMENSPPCAQTGECVDCSGARICGYTLIIEHQLQPRIEVVLIGESLGL